MADPAARAGGHTLAGPTQRSRAAPSATSAAKAGGEGSRNLGAPRPGDVGLVRRAPPRVRRPADALLALASALLVAVLLGLAHELPIGTREISSAVLRFVHKVPSGLRIGFGAASDLGAIACSVVGLVHLGRREPRTAVNALVAGVLATLAGVAAVAVWHARNAGVSAAMLAGASSSALVVVLVYLAFLTGSDLARRARWTRWIALSGGSLALSEVVLGALTAYAFLVVVPVGWGIGLATRWALQATSVQPSADDLRRSLRTIGFELSSLEPPRRRYGAFVGRLADSGDVVSVRLANRDTRGAGMARRLWGIVRLRSSVSGHQSFGRRSQLEQEALACYAAAAGGVTGPRVLSLAEVGDATLMLALACPQGSSFPEVASAACATDLFGALRRLHTAGVAHRDLRGANLLVTESGAGFGSFETAVPGSGELVRRIDVAQLLTTSASALGVEAAVEAMRGGYAPEDESLVAAMLQPVALAPWGWQSMRAAQGCLGELRRELLGDEDDAPMQVRLERFRWRTVLSTVALTFAAYVLVGQLSKVNLLGTLAHTNLGWVALAIGASAATYLGGAANLAAFVPLRLSLVRGFFVQLATAFVGMAMPPTVGHVAVNARYLHRQGVEDAATTAAVAISQVVNIVVTVPLLVVLGLLTGSGVGGLHLALTPTLLGGLGAIVLVAGALFAIPRTRHLVGGYLAPRLRHVGPRLLEAVSQPLRLLAGVGGDLLLTFGYVVALGAALLSVGAHVDWLAVAAVYLAGNTVGSAAPTPGGLGAVEVVLSAGLTAIGVPAHEAVSAVLIYRLATFWLPIPAGWVSYELLQRSGTL